KAKRESIDARNGADQLVYQTEKTLTDLGDKISADEKASITTKLDALKEALKGDDVANIKAKEEDLQKDMHAMSEKLYTNAAPQGAPQENAQPQNDAPDMGKQNDDNVVDADFKEV
ncbi:MAG: Hsp70 family protein, partial [Oscillospiraceae bacterium]